MNRRRFLTLLSWGSLALVMLAASSCRQQSPSLVLVTISGWCQGPGQELPALTAAKLENAGPLITPTLEAVPALSGLMTGKHPLAFGFRFGDLGRIPAASSTLAERFKSSGYLTAAFIGQPEVGPLTGLARGFDTWSGPQAAVSQGVTREEAGRLEQSGAKFKPAEKVIREAADWLRAQADQPVFVWIHLADLPQGVAGAEDPGPAYRKALEGIADQFRTLRAVISEREKSKPVVASVVSLHGLNLGESGEWLSGLVLTERVAAIPAQIEGGRSIPLPPRPLGLSSWGRYLLERVGLDGSGFPPPEPVPVTATFHPGRFYGAADQARACDSTGCLSWGGEPVWTPTSGPQVQGPASLSAAPPGVSAAVKEALGKSVSPGPILAIDPIAFQSLREAREAIRRGDALAGWEKLTRAMAGAPQGLAPRTAALEFLQSLPDGPTFDALKKNRARLQEEVLRLAEGGNAQRLDASNLLLTLGQTNEALTILRRVPRSGLNPGEQLALFRRFLAADGMEEAAQILEPLAEADPEPELLEMLGDLYARQGNGFRARQVFERALQKPRGRSAPLVAKLGDTLAGLGEKEAALQRYAEAVALDPSYLYPHSRAADVLLALGRPGQAADAVVKSIPSTGDPILDALVQGQTLSQRGFPGAAVQVWEAALKQHPQDYRLKLNLARIFIDNGVQDRGGAMIQEVLSRDPEQPLALVEQARLFVLEGKPELARAALQRAEKRAGPNLTQRVRSEKMFLESKDSGLAALAGVFAGKGKPGGASEPSPR